MNSKQNAVDFFEEKAAEHGNEFSALFSKYKINAPVTGENVCLLASKGGAIAREIHNIIAPENYSGFDKVKAKAFATKAKDTLSKGYAKYQQIKSGGGGGGSDDSGGSPSPDNTKKIVIIGSIVIIVLIVVFVLIKMASKK